MIVRLLSAGKSFKGLGKYLTHDPDAATAERVAWTHTLNCANDHVPSAIHEMYSTYRDADLLKEEAGIRRGGRPLADPVKHLSLNWHPDETPDRQQMIAAAESYLSHMGWEQHQAVLAAHEDKAHAHVHVMLNAVHPETGCKLDDGLERRRSSEWAAEYERVNGRIYCEQRLAPVEEREPAPTRPTWMAMQEAAQAEARIDAAREAAEAVRDAAMPRIPTQQEEWQSLRDAQREARTEFFADGRDAFKALRATVFREVREEFRDEWGAYYAARREGMESEALQALRDDLVARQAEVLQERRDLAVTELRGTRDGTYAALLAAQREDRAELTARQVVMDDALAGMRRDAANENAPALRETAPTSAGDELRQAFRDAAREVAEPVHGADDAERVTVHHHEPSGFAGGTDPRVRDGTDVVAGIGLGMLGGAATLVERLFDGFLDSGPARPASANDSRPEPPPPRSNPFAAVAEEARRTAEREAEAARDNAWWDERHARSRD